MDTEAQEQSRQSFVKTLTANAGEPIPAASEIGKERIDPADTGEDADTLFDSSMHAASDYMRLSAQVAQASEDAVHNAADEVAYQTNVNRRVAKHTEETLNDLEMIVRKLRGRREDLQRQAEVLIDETNDCNAAIAEIRETMAKLRRLA